MRGCSFKSKCLRPVVYACGCTEPEGHFCEHHFKKHSIIDLSGHLARSVLRRINDYELSSLQEKSNKLKQCLKDYKRNTLLSAKMLMSHISKEVCNIIRKIDDLSAILKQIQITKDMNQRDHFILMNATSENNNQALEQGNAEVKEAISKVFGKIIDSMLPCLTFQSDTWKDCDKILYSNLYSNGKLYSIDLNTLQSSNLELNMQFCPFSQICKFEKDAYFIHGGFKFLGNEFSSEALTVNLMDNRCESLPNGPSISLGGSVLMNRKIYIFGGHNRQGPRKASYNFDLTTNTWSTIHDLPQVCSDVTAALLNKDILITGLEIDCCFCYDGTTYSRILSLENNRKYKLVCEGWLLTQSNIYEIQKYTKKIIKYNLMMTWSSQLCDSAVFQKKHFFYFIVRMNGLMRIDTKRISIEKINYK